MPDLIEDMAGPAPGQEQEPSALLGAMGGDEQAGRRLGQEQRLQTARSEDARDGDTDAEAVTRDVARVLPFAREGFNWSERRQHANAQERMRAGNPEEGDYSIIARFERHQREEADKNSTLAGHLGQRALQLPGEAAEFLTGGRILGAAGIGGANVLSGASWASRGAAAATAGRLAAQTAAVPAMYAEDWQRRNLEAGRASADPRGLAPAFGLGMMQTAILGSLGQVANGVGGAGLGGALARNAVRTGTGILEQQAADTVASAIGLQTGYGTLGAIVRGDDDAFRNLMGQALTFSAFSAMHGRHEEGTQALRAVTDGLREMAGRGDSREHAAAAMGNVVELLQKEMVKNPDLTRAEARALMENLPEGPAREAGLALADTFQQRIEHAAAQGPEPGIDREAPGGPETSAVATGDNVPEGQSAAAQGQPGGRDGIWHNQGTEFRDVPGRPVEFTGSDGKNYQIEHTTFAKGSEKGGEHGKSVIQIKDGEHVVAAATALHRPDGNVELHFYRKTDASGKFLGAKGMGAVLHDYADKTLGDIVHPSRTAFGMSTSPAGEAVWRNNAARQKATYASANGPGPQEAGNANRPGAVGQGGQGSPGAGGETVRPGSASVAGALTAGAVVRSPEWQARYNREIAKEASPRQAAQRADLYTGERRQNPAVRESMDRAVAHMNRANLDSETQGHAIARFRQLMAADPKEAQAFAEGIASGKIDPKEVGGGQRTESRGQRTEGRGQPESDVTVTRNTRGQAAGTGPAQVVESKRVEAMRRRQQGLAPIKTPEQPSVEPRVPEKLSQAERAAEEHFAKTRYEDVPKELRFRVERVVEALKGSHDPEAIRQSARSAYAAGGEEGLHELLQLQEGRLKPGEATPEKLRQAQSELHQANKEFQDEVERAYRYAQRSALIEASVRRRLAERVQKADEDAAALAPRAGDAGPAQQPAAAAGAAQATGAGPADRPAGAPAAAHPEQAAGEQLSRARAAKLETVLTAAKNRGGIHRDSAIGLYGKDFIKALEREIPSLFKGKDKDGKLRAGTRAMDELAEEMHKAGEIRTPETHHHHDWLLEQIRQKAAHLNNNFEHEARRVERQLEKEAADVARAGIPKAEIGKVQGDSNEAGTAESTQRSAEEASQDVAQTQAQEPKPGGHLNERGEFVDESGTVRFFVPPGGRVPRGPGQGPPASGRQPPGGQGPAGAGGGGHGGVADSIVTPAGARQIGEGILRQHNAEQAQRRETARDALWEGKKYFDVHTLAAPDEQVRQDRFLEYTDAIEHGRIDSLPQEQRDSAEVVRRLFDERERMLTERGLLQSYVENYFGHVWKDPANPKATAQEIAQRINSRRTLTGGESFRKKRVMPTFRDGIEAGLEPASWNPVEIAQMKIDEIDHSIFGRDAFEETRQQGINRFVRLGQRAPDGWRELPDKLATVLTPAEVDLREYFDKKQMEGLERFADSMGFKIKTAMRGPPGSSETGGDVTRRFGTPEEVLIHEFGHQVEDRYHLRDWTHDPALKSELEHLADLRSSGHESQAYRDYIREPQEQIANLFAGYLHAPDLTKEVAPHAFEKLEQFLQSKPELVALRDVKPSLELGQRDQARRLAGPMLTGHYYMPDEVATLFERHLSPGLGGYATYRAFRGVGNQMNMIQLGLSYFHAGMTALNAQISAMGNVFRSASRGDVAEAARQMPGAIVPLYAIAKDMRQGLAIRREYFKPGSQAPETAELVKYLNEGGGRARMDQWYDSGQFDKFQTNLRQAAAGSNLAKVGVALRFVPAMVELGSKPMMQHMVPLAKMGAFANMARYELSKLGPDATLNQRRAVLGKVWDSVDNRYGQVTYDNLFWNRVIKDIAMGSVRSVGWNLGTVRELGGAVADVPSSLAGVTKGEGVSIRLAYLAGLATVPALYGAMIQYLLTGKGPEELKDLYFPKTGRTRPDGSPDRISLPSYIRDIASLLNRADEGPLTVGSNLVSMAKHKVHPSLALIGEMTFNEDYYGTAIRNPGDPLVSQFRDEIMHVFGAFEPFSSRGFRQQRRTGASVPEAALNFIGVTPAPGYVTKTSEQQRQSEANHRFQMTPQERRKRMGMR
ncbi:MAG: hypothetical protein V4472_23560 [Pseudomonadota bacterium]